MTAETILVALVVIGLVAAVAVYVFRPLLGGVEALEDADPRAVALLAEREAVLLTLRDLDADRADGRLGEDDYHRLRSETVARGSRVLAALDQVASDSAGRTAALTAELEAEVAVAGGRPGIAAQAAAGVERGAASAAAACCTHCGRPSRGDDRYCGGCGQPLAGAAEQGA